MKLPLFLKNKHHKTCLSINDLKDINELLRSGFNLANSLSLLTNLDNDYLYNQIIDKLNLGYLPSEFFNQYCKLKVANYLNSYLAYLPFNESVSLTINIIDNLDTQFKELKKSLIYPISLFFISIIGIYLFNIVFLPSFIKMLNTFNTSFKSLEVISNLLTTLISIFLFIVLIILCILMYLLKTHQEVLFYVFICKYTKIKLIKKYLSNQFAIFFKECLNAGFKAKQSMDILKSLKNKPLVVFMAYHIDQSLLNGLDMQASLNNIYLDKELAKFMNVAIYSNNIPLMLDGYILSNNIKIKRSCKKIALSIQMISYLAIGILIIFIYQILFLPLSIMSQM